MAVFGFDREFYLETYPDVAAAGVDPEQHYIQYGANEGRSPSAFFNERYYLDANLDVKAAVQSGALESGYQHFLLYGQYEGRDPVAGFDEQTYLTANPDVAAAVANHLLPSGWEHFVLYGNMEGRSGADASLMNTTVGGGANDDTLTVPHGDSTVSGGEGNDRLSVSSIGGSFTTWESVDTIILNGGAGADVFEFSAFPTRHTYSGSTVYYDAVIQDFHQGMDKIEILYSGFTQTPSSLEDVTIADVGGHAVITLAYGQSTSEISLLGVTAAQLSASDFIFTESSYE